MLEITVFACGALVMTFEIIGSRILSPFLGASTYIWTSLIGVILASLSLGYWLGGRAADRKPDLKYLAAILIVASGLISLTALIKEVLLSKIAGLPAGLELKALIAAILLFAPASVCLGFVTPFAVRLRTTTLESTGRTVGRLYALSTIGSIVGTFAAGFLLIPFVGSVRTLYLIAASLFILSVMLVPLTVTKAAITSVILLVFGITATEANIYLLRATSDVHDIDTEYSRIQVFTTTELSTNKEFRALATDPYFVQSAIYLDSDELVLKYGHFYHLIRYFKPDLENTLIIGGAGYTFPMEYLRTYPTAKLDVVEIDPQMTEIARRFFRMKDDPQINIIHEDGRMFINRTDGGKYDAILMDAFGSLFSVPTHLTTIEAVKHFGRILKDNGVVIFNLGSAINGPGSRFLNAELATYKKVFPNVYIFKVNFDYPDEKLQNLIIVASKSSTPFERLTSDPQIASLLEHRYTNEIPITTNILTDDLAPVEYYNSIAQNIYLSERR
ncbi:MAG: fused MFS/spermidine synthase [Pyrinomonadaceae bacterium]